MKKYIIALDQELPAAEQLLLTKKVEISDLLTKNSHNSFQVQVGLNMIHMTYFKVRWEHYSNY